MSLQVEKLEKNMAKLTIEVPAEEFDAAIKNAYNKNKNKFSIPGFRKGKAPLAMLEKMYGAGIFYEDAANEVIDASYPKAAEESKEEIVSTPEIKVTQIEKGKAFIYEATVALKPEVTLGEYKGVEVKKAEAVDCLGADGTGGEQTWTGLVQWLSGKTLSEGRWGCGSGGRMGAGRFAENDFRYGRGTGESR